MADSMDIDLPTTSTAPLPIKTKPSRKSKPQTNGKTTSIPPTQAATADAVDDVMEDPDINSSSNSASESDNDGILLDPDEFSDDGEDEEASDASSDQEEDAVDQGGIRLSPSAIPTTDSTPTAGISTSSSVLNPQRPTPYVTDAGHLLITDPNPLPSLPPSSNPAARESILSSNARDAAQVLLNTLLTTCPITTTTSTSTSRNETSSGSGVLMTLPATDFQLPREKCVPELKGKTKWARFAEKKGIKSGKKDRLVFDEERGEWRPRFGMRAAHNDSKNQWLVEVDDNKKGKAEGDGDVRKIGREEKREVLKRQARREARNEGRGKKGGG